MIGKFSFPFVKLDKATKKVVWAKKIVIEGIVKAPTTSVPICFSVCFIVGYFGHVFYFLEIPMKCNGFICFGIIIKEMKKVNQLIIDLKDSDPLPI